MAKSIWLYRVLETDDDNDPYDFGVVRASTAEQARQLVEARLEECVPAGEPVTVKLYPLKDQASGVLRTDTTKSIEKFPFGRCLPKEG
jgi:hypothetical protein